jgi:hypothetical protein
MLARLLPTYNQWQTLKLNSIHPKSLKKLTHGPIISYKIANKPVMLDQTCGVRTGSRPMYLQFKICKSFLCLFKTSSIKLAGPFNIFVARPAGEERG